MGGCGDRDSYDEAGYPEEGACLHGDHLVMNLNIFVYYSIFHVIILDDNQKYNISSQNFEIEPDPRFRAERQDMSRKL